MSKNKKYFIAFMIALGLTATASAQEDNVSEDEEQEIFSIEKDIEKNTPDDLMMTIPETSKVSSQVGYDKMIQNSQWSDIIVIQKNYLQKSRRAQFFAGGSLATNDVFYDTIGLNLKSSYHFTETWGLEAQAFLLTSPKGTTTKQLEEVQGINVQNLTTAKSYLGLNIYFNSMYGKAGFGTKKIIPFEIYQTLGTGQIETTSGLKETAFSIGLGQHFALSRSSVFRVDFSWLFFKTTNALNEKQNANILFLTVGWGYFWPGTSNR